MWSTVKERSTIPSLPAIDAGSHDNQFPEPTTFGGTMADRMRTLEVSNKALLEEMVHIHAAMRREKEETKKTLSEVVLESSRQLKNCQSSSDDVMSHNKRMADRVTRLERSLLGVEGSLLGVEGVLTHTHTDKEKQETWLKESFSGVHDRVSWLTNKMEAAVTDLTNTLKNLEDSCANKHTEFAATVTTTLEANHVLVEKKIAQLEKIVLEDQDFSKQLSATVDQVTDELKALTDSYTKGCQESELELSSLRESLGGLARESTSRHRDISTVLEAEIKTRQKALSEVRGQCAQVQLLTRNSVQTLSEGLIAVEEKMSLLRKEVVASHEQQVAYCQEMVYELHNDVNVQLTTLHHRLQATTRDSTQVVPTNTSLPTIVEEGLITAEKPPSEEASLHKVEQNKELLTQSRVLLDQSEDLKTSHEESKNVLEQLQFNLRQSKELLEKSRIVQSNLEQKKREHTQTNLEANTRVLEQLQLKLNASDEVQATLDQSKQVLDELKAQLEYTKQASDQIQQNLNRSKSVLEQLQSNVVRSQSVLDEAIFEKNDPQNNSLQLSPQTPSDDMSIHIQSAKMKTTEIDKNDNFHLESEEVPPISPVRVPENEQPPSSVVPSDQSSSEQKESSQSPEPGTPVSDTLLPHNGPPPLTRAHTWLDPMLVPEEEDLMVPIPPQQHTSTEYTPSQATPTPSQATSSQATPTQSQTTPTLPTQSQTTPTLPTQSQATLSQDGSEASDAGDNLVFTMQGSS